MVALRSNRKERTTRLRITRSWSWNPITWSWYAWDMNVETLKDGELVNGTLRMVARGPLHTTEVLV